MFGHGFEHLGGDDNRFVMDACQLDQITLDQWHLLGRQLDAQIATGHHNAVGLLQDAVDVGHRLGLFDLGDDRDRAVQFFQVALQGLDIAGIAHKAERHIVGTQFGGQRRIVTILAGKGRYRQFAAGQIHPLVVAQHATADNPAMHLTLFDGLDRQLKITIVQQDAFAGLNVFVQIAVLGGDQAFLPKHIAGGDNHLLPHLEGDGTLLETPRADLGAAQIHQDRYLSSHTLGSLANQFKGFTVLFVAAMGHIQAYHIDPGLEQFADHLRAVAGRAEGGNDLGATPLQSLFFFLFGGTHGGIPYGYAEVCWLL